MNASGVINCLLVEHDEDDVEIFKMALEMLPYKVNCTVYNDHKSFDLRIREKELLPSFIFYNPHMNNIVGESFLNKIKLSPTLSRLPLILLLETSFSMQTNIVKSINAQGFIEKENTVNGLADNLNDFFSQYYNRKIAV